ncbi:TadE/TadG family type IV pilus assembly protein [Thermaurantiacus sp.]
MPIACPVPTPPAGREDERGAAALEMALLLPVLVALLLGVADVAIAAARAREVEALAGSAAAALQRLARDRPALPSVAAGPAGFASVLSAPVSSGGRPGPRGSPSVAELVQLPPGVTGAVTLFHGCPTRQGIAPASSAACPGGGLAASFARIELSASVRRLLPWPETWLSPTVEARAIVRLD